MGNETLAQRLANHSPAKRALLELRLKQKTSKDPTALAVPRRLTRETAPLSFAQQRLWFLNQLEPESAAYNEPKVIRIKGSLNVQALESALVHVVERHEILRTTIRCIDGTPLQVVNQS